MKPPRSMQDDSSKPPAIVTSSPPVSINQPPVGLPASSLLFIHSALEKIQAIKETKKNKPLKEAVGNALDMLKQNAPEKKKLFGKPPSPVTPTAPKDPAIVANVVFFPLRLAALTPSPQLQIEALDCLGKLLSYGYISDGRMSGTITPLEELPELLEKSMTTLPTLETKQVPGAGTREEAPVRQEQIPLIDRAIDVICDCFVGEGTDEKVQLQIIKALLSAVSSTIVPIHQATLLKAVRTTYNIFLLSRNPTNQTIAQSTLTQMVHIVFGRIKISPTFHTTTFSSATDSNIAAHSSVTSLPQLQSQQQQSETSPTKDPSTTATRSSSVASSLGQLPNTSENGMQNSTDAGVEENNAVDEDAASDLNASFQSRLHSSVTSPEEVDIGMHGIEKRDMAEAVEKAFDDRDDKVDEAASPVNDSIHDGASDAQSQATESEMQSVGEELDRSGNGGVPLRRLSIQESRASLLSYTDELGSDVKPRVVHAQSPLVENSGADSGPLSLSNRSGGTSDVFTKDAFWVFRALCRLSMKPLPTEGAADLKSHSMRSKLLALHLILNILTSHLQVFTSPTIIFVTHEASGAQSVPASPLYPPMNAITATTTTTFIEAVKQYLCLTLSRNAVSVVPAIFETSLDIFARIIEGLRNLLRKEIEVFFNEIILSLLELKTASFSQKYALLNTLYKVCDDPRVVVEIYLNYDCDKEALDNIYERIVNVLSRVTTTRTTSIAVEPANTTSSLNDSHNGYSVPNAIIVPPSLTTANVHSTLSVPQQGTAITEWEIKHRSLECLVALLRSLVAWCGRIAGDGNLSGDANLSPGGGGGGGGDAASISGERTPRMSEEGSDNSTSIGNPVPPISSPPSSGSGVNPMHSRPKSTDDPSQFEELKHRKQLLQEGIRQFNFRPKKGIKLLIATGCIPARASPTDIARFLLTSEGLSKANVGEYLGEGDPENIAIMHAFVNEMDFSQTKFVDALRMFLQRFRLPGEAQKIDRFMLKFAERYLLGNPGIFSNADTVYVLAYSTIMLNTDLHNPQVKKRMTQAEFIRNNRGIDNNASLPDKLLQDIYDEILINEIKLKDEHDAAALAQAGKLDDVTLDSRTRREAHAQISEDIAQKTEALFKGMVKSSKNKNRRIGSAGGAGTYGTGSRRQYTTASHFQHVRPMFEVAWMALLTGISGPLQESDDIEVVSHCLEGFGHAIRIISLFDMELERNAFVTTLAKFTFLNNLGEMKPKNVEAIKALLEIATVEGNYLKDSWKEVLTCVSQLERFQLISSGVGQNMVPELSSRQGRQQNLSPGGAGRRSTKNPPTSRQAARRDSQYYPEDAAIEAGSQKFVVLVDRIFTMSSKLSGVAIVDFVRCLSDVSWDEIQSSSHLEHARTFSLQRLVEIAYYNMNRIRLEWSNVWAIMGDHFNMVGCHANVHVGMYALDSLRQLSMKFLEKEELANYQFQKEFLKPFEYIMANNQNVNIKDMVLRCLLQMIQARAHHLKSGWKTMFGVFTKAAQQPHEAIVVMSFDIVRTLYKDRFEDIIGNGTYPDFVECLVAFCENIRFERTSLQAIEILRQTVTKMVALSQAQADDTVLAEGVRASSDALAGGSTTFSLTDHPEFRFWYPTLNGYLDVIMTCMDLEVRTRALTYFFDALKEHGGTFTRPFWEDVAKKALFPIFDILRPETRERGTDRFPSKEDTTVWLSTTLIQALRSFVDLFSLYFDVLNSILLDGVLDLLTLSINQENETLSRMGTACLQQLIETNAQKLDEDMWHRMVQTFVTLFEVTMPHALFADSTRNGSISLGRVSEEESPNGTKVRKDSEGEEEGEGTETGQRNVEGEETKRSETPQKPKTSGERSNKSSFSEAREDGSVVSEDNDGMAHSFTSPTSSSTSSPTEEGTEERQQQRRRLEFQQIITKCVLQLLLVQNLTELLTVNGEMYGLLKSSHLFGFLDCLERSYRFAQDFNRNTELRFALWKVGFMRQLPNLLKQETNSVSCHLTVLIRMYMDPSEDRRDSRAHVEAKLIRLSFDIIEQFNRLDQLDETKRREVASWRPVVVAILNAIGDFEEADFTRHIPMFYDEIVTLLSIDPSFEIRLAVVQILRRTGKVYDIVPRSITDV